ncbi:signal peptidase I [Paenibacillus sp. strain BS8-2]
MADSIQAVEETRISRQRSSSPTGRPSIWRRISLLLLAGLLFLVVHNSTGLMKVSGQSMLPSLENGDILLMNKVSMLLKKPKYGDVMIIHLDSLGYNIVKRVIAVEGDIISITDGTTYVNGQPLVELYTYGASGDMPETQVANGHVFVMGDNRTPGESLDSRDPLIAQVPLSSMRGFVAVSLWPMRSISKPLEL